jgi:hypothetical protein
VVANIILSVLTEEVLNIEALQTARLFFIQLLNPLPHVTVGNQKIVHASLNLGLLFPDITESFLLIKQLKWLVHLH